MIGLLEQFPKMPFILNIIWNLPPYNLGNIKVYISKVIITTSQGHYLIFLKICKVTFILWLNWRAFAFFISPRDFQYQWNYLVTFSCSYFHHLHYVECWMYVHYFHLRVFIVFIILWHFCTNYSLYMFFV